MGCDLCGKEGQLFQARIEGTVMTVCAACKGYGEVIRAVPTEKRHAERRGPEARHVAPAPVTRETMLLVAEGYGPAIKRARERLGLKQEELAQRLRIKESQLHKYESGTKRPDLETARMLERALRIRLVEEHVEEGAERAAGASGPVTIGDLIRKD